ncbi:hypothetical protein [Streptomyces sp. NPDC029004]|uniref:hypothetical protein n=1 Tax=Streptomyces sp. NPDC029004 TaxID=3154490 RepID=UPI0033ED3C8F
MGLFSSTEEIDLSPPGLVAVSDRVAEQLPDPGEHLLRILGGLSPESYELAAAEIDRVRHANGAVTGAGLTGVAYRDWKSGPLTLLVGLRVADGITTGTWASFGLGRKQNREVRAIVETLVQEQGVPAAATWTVTHRAEKCDVDFLAERLTASYEKQAGLITNGDVIKAFRKWQR